MSDKDHMSEELRAMKESGQIYSPEASDYSRFGDWQTKAVVVLIVTVAALLGVGIWTL